MKTVGNVPVLTGLRAFVPDRKTPATNQQRLLKRVVL